MIPARIQLIVLHGSALLFGLGACSGTETSPPHAPHVAARKQRRAVAVEAERQAELPAAQIVQHLRGNEGDLRRCFFTNPSLRGAATFSWSLDVMGKVQAIRREASTLGDGRVEACLSDRLGEIRFGDLEKPAQARWTFVFRLADSPANSKRGRNSGKKRRSPDAERGVAVDPRSSGSLAPDAINNVVEAGYPLFARCYRDGINRSTELGGTVRLRFVVASGGTVTEVSDGGSDLNDRQVVDCIAEGFYALRFPEPEHGTVQVLYRIGFEAG